MLILLALAAATASPDRAIGAMREASNAAIAAHDMTALRRVMAPGYTILPGSLGLPLTADAFAERIGAAFADPTFITYVRTPTKIEVATNGKRAAERGTWLGRWKKPDGEMRLTGVYQATWVPADGGWRLLSETFVSLDCAGSAACSEVD